MENLVSLKYLDSYEYEKVRKSVQELFADLHIEQIIKPKMKVLIKVCLPYSSAPDQAITTHPAIVRGVVDVLSEFGAKCILADSPYDKYTTSHMEKVYINTGMLEVANFTKCKLNYNLKTTTIDLPNGVETKSLTLLDIVNDVDIIINLAKVKIDKRLGYLGATSNLYGLVPAEMKTLILNRLDTLKDYYNYLIDIVSALSDKLVLNIADAVVALEAGESQRMLSCLSISKNVFSLDAVMLDILGLNLNESIVKVASDRGLVDVDNPYSIEEGESVEQYRVENFAVYDYKLTQPINKNRFKQRQYFNSCQQRPVIDANKCKGCTICSEICPTNAIMMKYDKSGELYAEIDYKKCIFCNRCHTGCPYSIVELKTPMGYKKLTKSISKYNKEKQS